MTRTFEHSDAEMAVRSPDRKRIEHVGSIRGITAYVEPDLDWPRASGSHSAGLTG